MGHTYKFFGFYISYTILTLPLSIFHLSVYLCANVGPQGLLVLGLPALFVPHSASLGPATATRVLSTPVPVSASPTGLDECLFFISLVSYPLAVGFSVSSGCARRRSVSTYAAILVLSDFFVCSFWQPPCVCFHVLDRAALIPCLGSMF